MVRIVFTIALTMLLIVFSMLFLSASVRMVESAPQRILGLGVVLTIFVSSISVVGGDILARRVANGSTVDLFGFNVPAVQIAPVGGGSGTSSPVIREGLLIGSNDGIYFLYDVCAQSTVRLPAEAFILKSARRVSVCDGVK